MLYSNLQQSAISIVLDWELPDSSIPHAIGQQVRLMAGLPHETSNLHD